MNFFESGIYKEAFEKIFKLNSIFRELHLSLCYDVLIKNHHSDREKAIRDISNYMWCINASQSPISSELTKNTTKIIYRDKLYDEMYDYYYRDSKTAPSAIAINNWIENEFLNNVGSLSLPIQSITVKYINKNDDLPKKNYSKFISSYRDKLNQKKEEFKNKLKESITNLNNKANDTIKEIRDNMQGKEISDTLRKLDSYLNSYDNTIANRTAEIEIIKHKAKKNKDKEGNEEKIAIWIAGFLGITTWILVFYLRINVGYSDFIDALVFTIIFGTLAAGLVSFILYFTILFMCFIFKCGYSSDDDEFYSKKIKDHEANINKESNKVSNDLNEVRVIIHSIIKKTDVFREYYINEQNRLKERQRLYSQLFLGDYDEYFTEIDGEEFVLELPSADELLKGFNEPIESVNSKIKSMIKRSKYEEKSD